MTEIQNITTLVLAMGTTATAFRMAVASVTAAMQAIERITRTVIKAVKSRRKVS